ncbi:MAG: hypothetical protein A2660_02695 [Candidatus Doudnabacteria bacterium RIFCSPHIGHO2_01_FULL_45_18]|uniref:Solute-binding protein family 5 domain-containing protein n=1 Tax=Candidatus Doudnabacteria bacterium RIFCSPHIGHO2_01_FULL_45_18 TaxID=1817823 RepID=A0A1F5NQM0_9BACT|nr:MAG: hypothetical protein A2660_02695 [Candidatus Doudnabacteria bacterium RIFCSPHIGHO2_01_FULL_45_18]
MRNLWLIIKNFFRHLWQGLRLVPYLRRQQIPHVLENFTKRERNVVIASLLVIILSSGFLINELFADDGLGPNYGGVLTEGLVGQPQYINPVLAPASGVDSDLSRVVYAQLLKFDQNQNLQPDLAANLPEVSADRKTYTLKLRNNLQWQDGKPLTADDVVFTIQTIQNAEYESPLRANWTRVKVQKLDDVTLSFQIREASAGFALNFTLGIIPKHVWGELTPQNFRLSDYNLKAVGSGPFMITEIKKTSDGTIKSVNLKSHADYFAGEPFINRLTFRFYDSYDNLLNAYQGKEIQSLGFVPFDKQAFLTANDKVNQYQANLPQYEAVFFNLSKAPVSEKAVRQALWLMTDRSKIIDEVYKGNAAAAFGPILPGSLGYNASIEQAAHYDLTEAAKILDKAGWVLGPGATVRMKNKKPLEFTLATSGMQMLNVKTAQILQSQWEQLGAKVHLNIVSSKDLDQNYIRSRNFDAILVAENVGADPDPYPFWHSSQSHDPGLNLSGFNNSEVDKLITEARLTADENVRIKNYARFQEIINEQLPAIFLVRSLYIYNTPKKMLDVNLSNIVAPSERFADISHWYFSD